LPLNPSPSRLSPVTYPSPKTPASLRRKAASFNPPAEPKHGHPTEDDDEHANASRDRQKFPSQGMGSSLGQCRNRPANRATDRPRTARDDGRPKSVNKSDREQGEAQDKEKNIHVDEVDRFLRKKNSVIRIATITAAATMSTSGSELPFTQRKPPRTIRFRTIAMTGITGLTLRSSFR